MQIKRFLYLFLISCTTILVGCEFGNDFNTKDTIISEQEEEILDLQSNIQKLNEKISFLEQEIQGFKDSNSFNKHDPVLKEDSWDRIIISQEWNDHQVVITDPNIIRDVNTYIIGGFYFEVEGLGSGPHSDVPNYQYTFIKGNLEQVIYVAAKDMVKIGDQYFYTDRPVHLLGNAFYTPPAYIDLINTPILTKLAYSGYLRGTNQYNFGIFSRFRNIGTIFPLTHEAKLIEHKPKDTNDLYETLKFFYYGETILVNIFSEKFVQIIDSNKEYWYELDDPTSVGRFLTAG